MQIRTLEVLSVVEYTKLLKEVLVKPFWHDATYTYRPPVHDFVCHCVMTMGNHMPIGKI